MSLLLDALKRAEQEKLARQSEGGDAVEREAANAPHASSPGALAAALELQPLSPPLATPSAARTEESQKTARTVFAAKAAPADEEGRSKGMLWVIIGVVGLVVIAAGGYVWYSISALTPKPVASARARAAPLPPSSSGSIPPVPADPFPRQPLSSPPAGAVTAVPSTTTPALPPPAPRPAQDTQSPEQQALKALADSRAAPQAPPLALSRTAEAAPKVPGEVASGYAALRSGNLATARRSYQAAISADPANIDAQLGLATVEARAGNRAAAALHYRKAMEVDPRNGTALAGLALLAEFSRPEQLETQLREDVASHPQSAALRFALGNLYSSQSRWREAQGEYFESYRLDPSSADVAFNLAVSLDHLGQGRAAADYYARALQSSQGQSAQFDAGAATRRLAELGR